MLRTAYFQLERASPQHTAASGEGWKGAVMPEPDLETKPWSSLAGGREKMRGVITQDPLGLGGDCFSCPFVKMPGYACVVRKWHPIPVLISISVTISSYI